MAIEITRLKTAQGHPLWVCAFPPCRGLIKSFVFLLTEDSLQHAMLLSPASATALNETCQRIQAASSLQGVLFAAQVIPLGAIVKVQRFQNKPRLAVVYAQGLRQKQAKLSHPVPDVYPELFEELRRRVAPGAEVVEEPLTRWEAASIPFLCGLACVVFGGFLFLASLNMDERQAELHRFNRREHGVAKVLQFLGPTGTAGLALLLLAACAVWATLRIVKRPMKDVVYVERSD